MKTLTTLLCVAISISLCGCNSVGNVVPENGPTMEHVYDSMGHNVTTSQDERGSEDDIQAARREITPVAYHASDLSDHLPSMTVSKEFRKVPNPELKMYVFPHLAGTDQVPIPGYTTAFNAYTQDHYALPTEGVS